MEEIQNLIKDKNKEIEEINKKIIEISSINEKLPLLEKKNNLLDEINKLLIIQNEIKNIKENELKTKLMNENQPKKRKKDIIEDQEVEEMELSEDNIGYLKDNKGQTKKKKLSKSNIINNLNTLYYQIKIRILKK